MKSVLNTVDWFFDTAVSSKSGKPAGSKIVVPGAFIVSSDVLNAATTTASTPFENLRGTPSRLLRSPDALSAVV